MSFDSAVCVRPVREECRHSHSAVCVHAVSVRPVAYSAVCVHAVRAIPQCVSTP